MKGRNFPRKEPINVKGFNENVKLNGFNQSIVEPINNKSVVRKEKFDKKPPLSKSNGEVYPVESTQDIQAVAPKSAEFLEIKQQGMEFDEWCNILEKCEPCSEEDESVLDNNED